MECFNRVTSDLLLTSSSAPRLPSGFTVAINAYLQFNVLLLALLNIEIRMCSTVHRRFRVDRTPWHTLSLTF